MAWPPPERLWSPLAFITPTTSTTALGFNTTRLMKAAHHDEDEVRLAPQKWGHADLLAHAMGGRKVHTDPV